MALFTKRQFADLTGLSTNNLAVYIRRDQVVLRDGKCACRKNKCACLIDDQQENNRAFIEKMGLKAPQVTIPEKEPLRMVRPPRNQEELDSTDEEEEEFELTGNDFPALQKQKLKEQIRELQKKNKLHEAKIERLYEEVIPREHVLHLVVGLSESAKGAWMRATETFITQFAAANQMTREDSVYWRKQLTGVINDAVTNAAVDAKKNIRRLAKEYAGKRGKGERE